MALLPASSQLIKISSKLCITVTVLVTVLITDRWKELPTNCKRFSKGCKLIIGWIPLIPLSRFFLSQRVLYVGQSRSFLEWGKKGLLPVVGSSVLIFMTSENMKLKPQ